MKQTAVTKLHTGLPAHLLFLLLLASKVVASGDCPFIPKLNSPVNILHEYTRFLFEVMNPQTEEVSIRLIKYVKMPNSALHRFFFEMKYPQNRMKFIGTEAAFNEKAGRYVITKYLQSYDLEDIKKFFEDHKLSTNDGLFCENLKQNFLKYFYAHNYVQTILIDNFDILSKDYQIEQSTETKEKTHLTISHERGAHHGGHANSVSAQSTNNEKEVELELHRRREKELAEQRETERQQELERQRQREIELEKAREREREEEQERRRAHAARSNVSHAHQTGVVQSDRQSNGSAGRNWTGSNPLEGLLTYENISADKIKFETGNGGAAAKHNLQREASSREQQASLRGSDRAVRHSSRENHGLIQSGRSEMGSGQRAHGEQRAVVVNQGHGHSHQQSTGHSHQQSTGHSHQQSTGHSSQQASGHSSQQASGHSRQQASGHSSQQASGHFLQHASGKSAQEAVGHSSQQNSGQSSQQASHKLLNGIELSEYLAKLKSSLSTVEYNRSSNSGLLAINPAQRQITRPIQGVIRPTEYYFEQLTNLQQIQTNQPNRSHVQNGRTLHEKHTSKFDKQKSRKRHSRKFKPKNPKHSEPHQFHKESKHIGKSDRHSSSHRHHIHD
jgi:hypothetical protein